LHGRPWALRFCSSRCSSEKVGLESRGDCRLEATEETAPWERRGRQVWNKRSSTGVQCSMKLVAQVKLLPTPKQKAVLLATMERANAACNAISEAAWEAQAFGQYQMHRASYHAVKARFGLSAQVVVRCISKVADAYKLDKDRRRTFKPRGAIAYDSRILRYRTD